MCMLIIVYTKKPIKTKIDMCNLTNVMNESENKMTKDEVLEMMFNQEIEEHMEQYFKDLEQAMNEHYKEMEVEDVTK